MLAYRRQNVAGMPQAGHNYSAAVADNIWAQDTTYLKLGGRFYFLAVVLCLRTRRILAYNLSESKDTHLTLPALQAALRRHTKPLFVHNDQGSEYLSGGFRGYCRSINLAVSCSSPGNPYENGFVERAIGILKEEMGDIKDISSPEELLDLVATTIAYYNNLRYHSALKTTPAAYARKLNLDQRAGPLKSSGGSSMRISTLKKDP